jgi:hypothetical protein
MVLKRVGVLSAAKIGGVMYAAMGLLVGLGLATVFSIVPMVARGSSDMPSWLAPMFGVGSLIGMPIVYGLIGFVGGAISAVIYNLVAGMVGGVELHLEPGAPHAQM